MHFMSQPRYNPRTQRDDWYYRIKESFRDLTGRVRSRVMLNVGFIDEPHHPEDIRDIGKCLTYIHEHQGEKDLFGNPLSRYNEFVQRKAQEFWHEMVNNGSIDAVKTTMEESRKKAERLVDVNTIEHTDAREIGAEWVCLQAIRELEIDKFLRREGWSEIQINTTLAHLITRTIYSPSELKSMRIMDGNSAVCELISGRRLTDYETASDAQAVTVLDQDFTAYIPRICDIRQDIHQEYFGSGIEHQSTQITHPSILLINLNIFFK